MEMNVKKTKVMRISRQPSPVTIDIFVNCNWVNTRWQCLHPVAVLTPGGNYDRPKTTGECGMFLIFG